MDATRAFLDEGQYRASSIAHYEAVYGRGFVSPGGASYAREFASEAGVGEGARVLDVGCGLGGFAGLLAREFGARVDGIDLSANMVAEARARLAATELGGRVTLAEADALALDAEARYDLVVSRDVFLHVHDKARLFAVLHRALVPGGRLAFTDYACAPRPWSAAFEAYVAARGYDLRPVEDYVTVLETAGFADVRGEDRTARFVELESAELARIPALDLPAPARDALAAAWREKIGRARRGEQRWGAFFAHRPA